MTRQSHIRGRKISKEPGIAMQRHTLLAENATLIPLGVRNQGVISRSSGGSYMIANSISSVYLIKKND